MPASTPAALPPVQALSRWRRSSGAPCGFGQCAVASGQVKEDVVEGGAPKADVVDSDTGGVEAAQCSHERAGTVGGGDCRPAALAVDVELSGAERFQGGCGSVEGTVVVGGQLDDLSAELPFQLVWAALGHDSPPIDDRNPPGQAVRLFEVLGGEKYRGARASQIVDHLPQAQPGGRVKAGGGLVQHDDWWPGDEAGGQVEPPAHPSGVGTSLAVPGGGQLELLQEFSRSPQRLAVWEVAQLADHL